MNKVLVYPNEKNTVSVFFPNPQWLDNEENTIEKAASIALPPNTNFIIIDSSTLPQDDVFRNAWEIIDGKVVENLEKAKEICHIVRREKRNAEFLPLDEIIAKQIPGNDLTQVEEERQKIRDKYAEMQVQIENASDVNDLKTLIG